VGSPDDPPGWFTVIASFARIPPAAGRALLRVIDEKRPGSLDELARIARKAKSNLSARSQENGTRRPSWRRMRRAGLRHAECDERPREAEQTALPPAHQSEHGESCDAALLTPLGIRVSSAAVRPMHRER
jgi:hypothetical protein